MTDQDQLTLHIATRDYRRAGSRERVMREELGLTPTRFWHRVNQLIDDPAVALEDPARVVRLRRQRDRLAGQRRAS